MSPSARRTPRRAVRTAPTPGRIITFYSYKGGTGRSMLLANVAWILASNGQRVLAVDWDLEAPGLHHYFHPFLLDPEMTASEGVIDFVARFVSHAVTDAGRKKETPNVRGGLDPSLADLTEYAVRLDHEFPDGGVLDIVPAGRQSPGYAAKVNSFDWQTFYDRLGGGAFLQSMRELVRADYDVILIDSRTGVSDTAGLCTVELPDVLVVCFTLNTQSIEGAAAVAQSVRLQRSPDSLSIYPVPMRVEMAEKLRLERARDIARQHFDSFLLDLKAPERDRYWGDVEVMYQPFYAYEEVLAVFGDRPHQASSVLGAVERLTGRVTDPAVTALSPMREESRVELLARYTRRSSQRSPAGTPNSLPSVFVSYSHKASDLVQRLVGALESGGGPYRLVTALDNQDIQPGADFESMLEQAIVECMTVLAVVTSDAERSLSFVRQEWDLALSLEKPIIPVLVDAETRLPPALGDRHAILVAFDGSSEEFRLSVSRLGKAIETLVTTADGGAGASPAHRRVTLDVNETRVRLISDLDDVQAQHGLHGLDLQAIRVLEELMTSEAAFSPPARLWLSDVAERGPSRVLGELLYRGLLTGRVATVLEQLLEESAREPGRLLRLRLQFGPTSNRLEVLPWELLRGPPGLAAKFLTRRSDLRLTLGASGTTPRPLAPAASVLRALIVNATGGAPNQTPAKLLAGLSPHPEVQTLNELTPETLRDGLRLSPQLVHVVGRFAPSPDRLKPSPREGPTVTARHLLPFFAASIPALIILDNRGPDAAGARQSARDLVAAGWPNVLVVSAISREASTPFMESFYGGLLRGQRIDDAMAHAHQFADPYWPGHKGVTVSLCAGGEPLAIVRPEMVQTPHTPA